MPGRDVHLRQARHNEAVLLALENIPDNAADWKTTVLFYTALHYVDAYLATMLSIEPTGVHPRGHQIQDNRIGRNNYVMMLLRPIYADYDLLYRRSMRARYAAAAIEPSSYAALHSRQFASVVGYVKSQLNLP